MPTPTWAVAQNAHTNLSAQVTQFLGTHALNMVYEGSPLVTVTGTFAPVNGSPYQALNTTVAGAQNVIQVSQPFLLPSGTEIDRVVIPVSVLSGVGQDVVVSLQTDSAGLPSGTLAGAGANQLTVPKELIFDPTSYQQDINQITLSAYGQPPSITPPQAVGGISFPGFAFDGANFVLVGGQAVIGSTSESLCFVSQVNADGTMSPYVGASALPVGGVGWTCVTIGGFVVAMGQFGSSGVANGQVFVATLSSDGVLGGWTQQATLPVAVTGGAGAATTDNLGNIFIYYIAGSIGGVNTSTVYQAQLISGQIASWNTVPGLPYTSSNLVAVQTNGWVVIPGNWGTGNMPGTAVLAAKVRSDGSLSGWQTWPSISANNGDGFYPATCGLPNGVFFENQSPTGITQFLPVNADGPASWISLPADPKNHPDYVNPVPFTTVSGAAAPFVIMPGVQQFASTNNIGTNVQVATTLSVSVPLRVTGLTATTKYHLVIAGTATPTLDTCQVQLVASSSSLLALRKVGSAAWSSSAFPSGTAIPLIIYTGTAGHLAHILEDAGARFDTYSFDSYKGRFRALGESISSVRSQNGMNYDTTGQVNVTTTPTGWGQATSTWGYTAGGGTGTQWGTGDSDIGWLPATTTQRADATYVDQFLTSHSPTLCYQGTLLSRDTTSTSSTFGSGQYLDQPFIMGGSTTANNSISPGTAITFTSAPVGFYNGEQIQVDVGQTTQETVSIVSGAGTTSWVVTPALVLSHGAGVTITAANTRTINRVEVTVAAVVGTGADLTVGIYPDVFPVQSTFHGPGTSALASLVLPIEFEATTTTISLPLVCYGLTPGGIYHIVITPAGGTNGVTFSGGAAVHFALQESFSATGPWTQFGGAMTFNVYGGTGGRLVNTIEDVRGQTVTVQTVANNSVSANATSITFTAAPVGFNNGDRVVVDVNGTNPEVAIITAGQNTTTWTVASATAYNAGLRFAHGAGVTISNLCPGGRWSMWGYAVSGVPNSIREYSGMQRRVATLVSTSGLLSSVTSATAPPTWTAPAASSSPTQATINQFLGVHPATYTYTAGTAKLTVVNEDSSAKTTTYTYNANTTLNTIADVTGAFTGTSRTCAYSANPPTSTNQSGLLVSVT